MQRTIDEHRPWEQATISHSWHSATVQHRFRLEQRFVGDGPADAFWRYRNRFRYRGKATVPLTARLYLSFFEETFFTFGPGRKARFPEQNRLYAALGWRAGSAGSLEIGYLHQYLKIVNTGTLQNNHIIRMAFVSRFPFRRKK